MVEKSRVQGCSQVGSVDIFSGRQDRDSRLGGHSSVEELSELSSLWCATFLVHPLTKSYLKARAHVDLDAFVGNVSRAPIHPSSML